MRPLRRSSQTGYESPLPEVSRRNSRVKDERGNGRRSLSTVRRGIPTFGSDGRCGEGARRVRPTATRGLVPHGADGWQVGATTRSYQCLFLVPFTAAWGGFSLAATYGWQIAKGHFELAPSLFGIPFLVGTIFLTLLTLMALVGKTAVTVDGSDGVVFTGIGALGWRRRFSWNDIRFVEEAPCRYQNGLSRDGMQLLLVGERRLPFGSMWSAERREFVRQVLRRLLRGTV